MNILELGHVVLYVTDVERMSNFYRDVLGFQQIGVRPGMAMFSSGRTHHELLLIEVGGVPKPRTITPGLYHIGFKVGNTHEDIVEVYRHLDASGVEIVGTGHHGVTESLYIIDPDGNELELYADVSDEWKRHPDAVFQPVRPLPLS